MTDLADAIQEAYAEDGCVVAKWVLIVDVYNPDDTRQLALSRSDGSVDWELKAMLREALSQRLYEDDDGDGGGE